MKPTQKDTQPKKELTDIRNILEGSRIAMWQMDLSDNSIVFDDTCYALLGYSPEELPLKSYEDWMQLKHPADSYISLPHIIQQLNLNIKEYEYECRLKHKSGRWIWTLNRMWINTKGKKGETKILTQTIQDITSIKQSEIRMMQAQSLSKIGNWEYYMQTNEQFWSEEHYRIFELEKTEPHQLFEAYRQRIHPDDLAHLDKILDKVIRNKENLVFEHRAIFPDGRMKYILGLGSPIINEKGEVIGLKGTAQDITDRKKKELEIIKLKSDLSKTSEMAKIGFWEYDVLTQKLTWSFATKKIHEVPEHYEPKLDNGFYFYKEGYSREKIKEVVKKAIEYGEAFEVELQLITAKGREIWVKVIGEAEVINKKVYKVFGIFQDIDVQRRQQEKNIALSLRLNYALEASGDGIWDWDPITQTTVYSKRWAQMIGYELHELTSSDREWSSRLHPEDKERIFAEINKNVAGETESFSHVYRFKHKYGHYIYILNRGKVIERDVNGRALRVIGTHTDITEKKMKEKELKRTEELWQYAMENSGYSVWEMNFILGTITRSKNTIKLKATNENHSGTHSIQELIEVNVHPDDRQQLWEKIVRCKDGKADQFEDEHRVITTNGETRWFYLKGTVAEKGALGQPVRMVGIGTDITDSKKETEKALQLKDELQKFFDLSLDLMCIANVEGNFVKVNKSFSEMLGYSEEELLNQPFAQFIHQDDLAPTFAEVEKLKAGALTIDFENRYRCKNGEYIWLSWRSTPDVKTGMLYAAARNITRKKAQEIELKNAIKSLESYQKALNQIAIVGVADVQGNIIFANKKFTEISGYTTEELYGQNHRILNSGTHDTSMFIDLWKTIASGKTWKGEICNRNKNGQLYWVDTVIIPFLNEAGRPYQYFSIRTDITEKKKQQDLQKKNEELERGKELAERIAKLKGQFLANMSHELRTPMNAIMGITNLLKKTEYLHKKEKRYLEVMNLNSRNLMRIINDILDFSRIDAGRIQLANEPFNIKEKLTNILDIVAGMAQEKGLETEWHFPKLFHEEVTGDEVRFGQIIMNLMSNAVKFTEKGKISFELKVNKESRQEISLQFIIKDTGVGIPIEKQSEIFESFTQAKDDATRKFGGTGLGLSMANKLVELQGGGRIYLSSMEGMGAEFSFMLEYKKAFTGASLKNVNSTNEYQLPENMNILLVEDNEFNQLVAVDTIQDNFPNMQVDVAENGAISLEKLKENKYHIILMDLQMPVMDGHTATIKIRRELNISTPIIAMTANAQLSEIEFGLKNGMNFYVPKPFETKVLFTKMAEAYQLYLQLNGLSENGKTETSPRTIEEELKTVSATPIANNYRPELEEEDEDEAEHQGIVDVSAILDFTRNNKERIIKMVNMFLKDTRLEIIKMKELHLQKNYAALRSLAHSYKPKYTYMGMPQLSEVAKQIERNAANETDLERTYLLIEELERQTALASIELAQFLKPYLE